MRKEDKELQYLLFKIVNRGEITIKKWKRDLRIKVYEISGKKNYAIYYNTSEGKGWWGISSNIVKELENSGIDWYVILWHTTSNSGYVINRKEVLDKTKKEIWKLRIKDKNYKINFPNDLEGFKKYNLQEIIYQVND